MARNRFPVEVLTPEGEYDDLPERAFYMKGTIDEVLEEMKGSGRKGAKADSSDDEDDSAEQDEETTESGEGEDAGSKAEAENSTAENEDSEAETEDR